MTTNPARTASGIPRRAEDLLRYLADTCLAVHRHADTVHDYVRVADLYGQVHLLATVRHLAPHDADRIAGALADTWTAHHEIAPQVTQWLAELDADRPLTIPLAGEDDDQ